MTTKKMEYQEMLDVVVMLFPKIEHIGVHGDE
jgi:hypothetical protein